MHKASEFSINNCKHHTRSLHQLERYHNSASPKLPTKRQAHATRSSPLFHEKTKSEKTLSWCSMAFFGVELAGCMHFTLLLPCLFTRGCLLDPLVTSLIPEPVLRHHPVSSAPVLLADGVHDLSKLRFLCLLYALVGAERNGVVGRIGGIWTFISGTHGTAMVRRTVLEELAQRAGSCRGTD